MNKSGNILCNREMDSFLANGYLRIQAALPAEMIKKLQVFFEDQMFHYVDHRTMVIQVKDGHVYFSNMEAICCKGNLACLELLGHPVIMNIAEMICGADFFPVQDFAVIKMLGDEGKVLWHQDMINERSAAAFIMGIYLDDADEDDGALKVIKGSHLSGRSICELQKEPFIQIPMKAGDILVHDMMIAHSSEPLQKNKLRRVIYFEFLATEMVRIENIYSEELIRMRTLLQHIACNWYRHLHPQEAVYEWKNKLAESFEPVTDFQKALKEVYAMHVKARPSAYCFEKLS